MGLLTSEHFNTTNSCFFVFSSIILLFVSLMRMFDKTLNLFDLIFICLWHLVVVGFALRVAVSVLRLFVGFVHYGMDVNHAAYRL